jgi:hypothetical protein
MSNANFVSKLVQFALFTAANADAKAWLQENAPRMSKSDKVDADLKVVKALEQRYGVEATESKRPEFSGWTFKRDDAKQALYRARDILRGKTVYQAQAAHTDVVAQMAKYASSMRKKHGMTRKQAERAIAQAFAE